MKIAVFQMDARNAKFGDDGIKNIIDNLNIASNNGANILHFPELTLPGYGTGVESMRKQALIAPMAIDKLRKKVDNCNCCLAFGMPIIEGNDLYNAAIFLAPNKEPVVYFKRYLFGEYEKNIFSRGRSQSILVSVDNIKIGFLVCYDVEFPENVRQLALAGADMIIVPTALPAIEGSPFVAKSLIPTRGFENGVFISYADWCGSDEMFKYQGLSIIVGPDGIPLAQSTSGHQEMLTANIDKEKFSKVLSENNYIDELKKFEKL